MILRGLRVQLLVLALFPPLLLALGLGSYLSYNRSQDIDEFASARANALIKQLALAADFSRQHGDKQALQAMLQAALEETGLRAVSIFDQNSQLLAHSGVMLDRFIEPDNYLDQQPHNLVTKGLSIYIQPMQTIFPGMEQHGWVALAYQQDIFVVKRYQSYLTQNLILLVLMILAGLFGLWLGQKLIQDIRRINNHVKRIAEGDHASMPATESCSEMHALACNINNMAKTLQTELDELQHSVEVTTGDLKETIETIEIKNIELNLAQKEALTASRIKSEFLANTSHEIRTPLNGIIGFTRILKRTPLNAQQADYLETIQQSAQGLMAIINDILDFSKIEAGKLELENSLFNLKQTCEEVISLFAASCYEKNIELVLLLYRDVPVHLIGDAMRIKQLLSNLVNNAIKFTHSGTIAIRVAVEDCSSQQALISFAISDTGIGMDHAQQQSLFKAFAQGNTSISREYGGTGLGLAIVKKLADLMQGDIKVQSNINEGSTFTLSLRLKLAEDTLAHESQPLQGKSILVHDPHPLSGLAIHSLLQGMGGSAQLADTLQSAQQTLQHFAFDTVVCSMPPSHNIDSFIEQSRQLQQAGNCPLLLLLPPGHEKHMDILLEMGIAVSLKPVIEPKLEQAMSGLLHKESREQNTRLSRTIQCHKLHILAVDDQPANLKLLRVLLEDIGANVATATNGAQAIELCQQQVFDLILMDIQMPGIDGLQASCTIKEKPGPNHDTPIIAITAHALADERRQLLEAGMADYISKPVNESLLLSLISKWAKLAGSDQQVVDPELCLKLAGGKPHLAKDMFIMLAEHLPESLHTINTCYQTGQNQLLLEAVHKLHGACCYTGVKELRQITAKVETLLKITNDTLDPHWLEQLEKAINAVLDWQNNNDIEQLL